MNNLNNLNNPLTHWALSTFTLGQQTREVRSASVVRQSTTAIALHASGSIGVDLTSNLA
jgi:hypothetical protein